MNECPNEQTQNVIDIDAFRVCTTIYLAYRKSDGHTKQCANIIPAIAGQMNGNDQLCLFVYLFCSKCLIMCMKMRKFWKYVLCSFGQKHTVVWYTISFI